MMMIGNSRLLRWLCAALGFLTVSARVVSAEPPPPVLNTIFPAGGAAGSTVELTLAGSALTKPQTLRTNLPGARCEIPDATHARLTIPAQSPPGLYDVWAVCENGISAPRRFFVGQRVEKTESSANDTLVTAEPMPLDSVINGRIEQSGDQDHFQFTARQGQRVVLECWAERIDSRLRAVLELFDSQGRRLAVNRGYDGIDPLIDFRVPSDGTYVVKVGDLISSGGPEHGYRLDVDTGPRVAFTVPNVVRRGQSSRVTLFGWNLANSAAGPSPATQDLDQVEVEIPAELARDVWPLPVGLAPAQAVWSGFAYHFPGSQACVPIGVTDLPVIRDHADNHTPATAQAISYPAEVAGRLVEPEERDWFAIEAARGEVLYFDVLSQRIGSPTDLQLVLFDAQGGNALKEWNDQVSNPAGTMLPTAHLDPVGRWVAPADGRYLLMIRNLTGGSQPDPRRAYRLQVQRETPDVQLLMAPNSAAAPGAGLRRGGRQAFDIWALRQRGMHEAIRISATGLPIGIDCPDVWIGPDEDRATLVVSANDSVDASLTSLQLTGFAESVGERPVRGSTVVRAGTPNGWSRLTSEIPLAIAGIAPVRVRAAFPESMDHPLYGKLPLRYSPGGVLDVAVTMDQRNPEHRPAVRLTGAGLPAVIPPQTAQIREGELTTTISFFLPPTITPGRYSLAVSAETTVPAADGKSEPVTVISNPLTFTVEPAAFVVDIDPFAPRRLKRGETVQVKYSAARANGFIGKIHTELAAPGVVTNVPGLRGRGVTFVGQTDEGTIQIVVNEDAPLGPLPFLRLLGIGVVEDQAVYQGARFYPVEIVE